MIGIVIWIAILAILTSIFAPNPIPVDVLIAIDQAYAQGGIQAVLDFINWLVSGSRPIDYEV